MGKQVVMVPKCQFCGTVTAIPIYNASTVEFTTAQQYGDAFVRWDFNGHSCKDSDKLAATMGDIPVIQFKAK